MAEQFAEGAWLKRVPELVAMHKAEGRRSIGAAAAARIVGETPSGP